MKEDFQIEKEISIVEILKALLSKIIYLILALVLGAIAGGLYGYYSSKDYKVYGTKIQFYVNPSTDGGTATGESIYATYGSYSSNVMKNMVNLLESEIFAEKLIDGWYKAEKTMTVEFSSGTKSADLQAVCAQSFAETGVSPVQIKVTNTIPGKIVYYFDTATDLTNAKTELQADIDAANVPGGKLASATITGITESSVTTDIAGLAALGIPGAPTADEKWTDATKKTLTQKYKTWINIISNAVSFSFKSEGNIAESFINVAISLDGAENSGKGRETAIALSEQIKLVVPVFVEENMPTPANYAYTNCTPTKLITDVGLTNYGYANTQMVKLALVAGAVALIIAAIIVISLYMSDKRLRDIDVLPKTFNVPVLGVLPSIEESELRKMSNQGGNK